MSCDWELEKEGSPALLIYSKDLLNIPHLAVPQDLPDTQGTAAATEDPPAETERHLPTR